MLIVFCQFVARRHSLTQGYFPEVFRSINDVVSPNLKEVMFKTRHSQND